MLFIQIFFLVIQCLNSSKLQCPVVTASLTYFELAGDLQLGRRDAQGVVNKHHGEDGDEDGKVADDGPHLGEKRDSGRSESPLQLHQEPPGGTDALQIPGPQHHARHHATYWPCKIQPCP